MNIDIEKIIGWLNQLYAAPKLVLVFVSCLLLGHLIKRTKRIHNSAIPGYVCLWGAFWLPALSDWPDSSIKTVSRFILFNGFFGFVEGAVSVVVHKFVIKPLLKKAGIEREDDSNPEAFKKSVDQNAPKP